MRSGAYCGETPAHLVGAAFLERSTSYRVAFLGPESGVELQPATF